VRDEVLRYLSSLSVADTQGEAGKSKIQKEVVTRIDKELGGGRVRRLFFVDFMVQ
jgi:flagellar basal body-associated protein FliL